jgi:hypothetical protein
MTGMKRFKNVCAAMVVLACAAAGLPVRANAPSGRYTNGTGTVLDTKTKLTWQQPLGPAMMTWSAAKSYCAGLGATLAGSGWRLPTIKELATLVDTSVSSGPALDASYFPMSPSSGYWSSTLAAGATTFAWILGPSGGSEGQAPTTGMWWARCVR